MSLGNQEIMGKKPASLGFGRDANRRNRDPQRRDGKRGRVRFGTPPAFPVVKEGPFDRSSMGPHLTPRTDRLRCTPMMFAQTSKATKAKGAQSVRAVMVAEVRASR